VSRRRALRAAALVLCAAGCTGSGSGSGTSPRAAHPAPAVNSSTPAQEAGCQPAKAKLAPRGKPLRMRTIAVVKDQGTLSDIAVGGGYIAWSTIHIETGAGAIYERRIGGGPVTQLNGPDVVYPSGLASGPKGVYVVTGTDTQDVYLLPHGSGGTMTPVLRNLVAPMSQHGDLVAYAIGLADGRREIGVLDTHTGEHRVVATDRACENGRCSRIDQVELTDDAVVWAQGAIGDHPSYLVREPLAGGEPVRLRITGDVQPDLAAADGPVPFRRLGCTWQMWDGRAAAASEFDVPRAGQLISVQSGTWYGTLGGEGQTIVARGAENAVVDRAKTIASGGVGLYGGLVVTDDGLVVAGWNVYGAKPGGKGVEQNPAEGEQNDHEETSFAVVRLGHLR
jgi:hypothetical protein